MFTPVDNKTYNEIKAQRYCKNGPQTTLCFFESLKTFLKYSQMFESHRRRLLLYRHVITLDKS